MADTDFHAVLWHLNRASEALLDVRVEVDAPARVVVLTVVLAVVTGMNALDFPQVRYLLVLVIFP